MAEASALSLFVRLATEMPAPRVLEVGTKRSIPDRQTHHREWVPHSRRYVMADIEVGADVDVVADFERLPFAGDTFDVVIACSTLEHVRHPWRCAEEAVRVLRPGGLAYAQSHQSFPIHGYPSDYWRFTDEAFRLLVEDAGAECLGAGYQYRTRVVPIDQPAEWNEAAPAWLNVDVLARKPG